MTKSPSACAATDGIAVRLDERKPPAVLGKRPAEWLLTNTTSEKGFGAGLLTRSVPEQRSLHSPTPGRNPSSTRSRVRPVSSRAVAGSVDRAM
ncbi:hypothetical protein DFQ14_102351 [Halopolyspora algeriensis]|uniref:Uncharacterized protein n=1 Tax=Halopolyspora algeriensis TaxID=1500506 RepID=A0A368VW31_9ACTN|nr:hypothetical protein DFQ14_102351 [Halopolyspora algeriensis]TQM55460.1 hypothetical protein FHU43_0225 [Halopolyspora algeriensis]